MDVIGPSNRRGEYNDSTDDKDTYYVCIGMIALLGFPNIHPKLKICTRMLTGYTRTQENDCRRRIVYILNNSV